MSNVLAIIPARAGSKGIPNKNFKPITPDGDSPAQLALSVASRIVPVDIAVSSDSNDVFSLRGLFMAVGRPQALAQDDTPMVAVVRHVLETIPGPSDQKIVLLQPTQPLRQPSHVTAALALLDASVDSVVSVVAIPKTYHPRFQYEVHREGWLIMDDPISVPACRQDVSQTYTRDGTVYAFWRKTVTDKGTIYGDRKKALIIPADETCPLDMPADWLEAERRLRARA